MKFIKKYYPMMVSTLFLGIYSLFVGAVFTQNTYLLETDLPIMNVLAMLAILLVIVVCIEIVGFIIHAVKNNYGIWGLWIYLFNIFIIPYYNLKYVVKKEDNKNGQGGNQKRNRQAGKNMHSDRDEKTISP